MNQVEPLPQLVSPAEVRKALGVSMSTLMRMIERGEFPRAVSISRNRVAWRRADFEAWIAARFEAKP